MSSIGAAATQGAITPDEAAALSQMVESFTRTLDAAHVERRRHWRGVNFKAWWKKSRERESGAR